jgi:hypothetical protein
VIAFFSGLIERATQGATGLQRRPRSLFEPAVASDGTALEGVLQIMPPDLDARVDPVERGDASAAPRRELAPGGESIERAPGLDSSADAARPDRSAPADSVSHAARPAGHQPPRASTALLAGAAIDPSRFEIQRDELEPVTRLEPRAPQPVHRPGSGTPLPPPSRDSARPYRSPDGVARNPRVSEAAAAGADRTAVALAPAGAVAVPAGTKPQLVPAGPRIPVPPAVILQSAAGSATRPIGGVAPPAPVHVTIGRVEVRASAPAAERPPARRSAAGPRLTLDDYLNGRRRGAR